MPHVPCLHWTGASFLSPVGQGLPAVCCAGGPCKCYPPPLSMGNVAAGVAYHNTGVGVEGEFLSHNATKSISKSFIQSLSIHRWYLILPEPQAPPPLPVHLRVFIWVTSPSCAHSALLRLGRPPWPRVPGALRLLGDVGLRAAPPRASRKSPTPMWLTGRRKSLLPHLLNGGVLPAYPHPFCLCFSGPFLWHRLRFRWCKVPHVVPPPPPSPPAVAPSHGGHPAAGAGPPRDNRGGDRPLAGGGGRGWPRVPETVWWGPGFHVRRVHRVEHRGVPPRRPHLILSRTPEESLFGVDWRHVPGGQAFFVIAFLRFV